MEIIYTVDTQEIVPSINTWQCNSILLKNGKSYLCCHRDKGHDGLHMGDLGDRWDNFDGWSAWNSFVKVPNPHHGWFQLREGHWVNI